MQILMRFGNRASKINHRQNRKDKRLHESDKDMKDDENHGRQKRNGREHITGCAGFASEEQERQRQSEEDDVEHLAHHNVDPETNGEREQPGQMANRFHYNHERREREIRTYEVLAVV